MTTASDAIHSAATEPSHGLLARAFGVLFSPRTTYAAIAGHPRPLGALIVVLFVSGAASFAFLSTEVGQLALLDRQLTMMESFGVPMNEERLASIESTAPQSAYFSLAGTLVVVPLVTVVVAGGGFFVFSGIMAGNASFKQVFAIAAHSGFIIMLQVLFITPLNYVRESMSSATSLGVFLPMVDAATFPGMLLGSIDFFRIWWIVSLSIGLGVLYKKRTAPVAWSLLAAYAVIVLIVAGVRSALSGA